MSDNNIPRLTLIVKNGFVSSHILAREPLMDREAPPYSCSLLIELYCAVLTPIKAPRNRDSAWQVLFISSP